MSRLVPQTSAGGVLVRRGGTGFEACLIRRSRHGGPVPAGPERADGSAWCLPKGHLEAQESPEAAARREVQEETGLQAEIVEPLGRIAYRFKLPGDPAVYDKTVIFFLMRAVGGSIDRHDDEALEARWMPLDEARREATYENERRILDQAEALLARPEIAAQVGG